MNIFCISLTYYPGNGLSDTSLVQELSKSRNKVTFAIKSNEMYKNYKKQIKIR